MAAKKQQKELIVIAIYHLKKDKKLTGATVYRVRSSQPNKKGRVEGTDQVERNGQWYNVYKVSEFAGHTTGCTCPAVTARCYHRAQIDERNAAKVKASQQVVEKPTQPIVSPEPVSPVDAEQTVEQPVFDPEKHFWNPNLQCYCYRLMPKEPVAFLADMVAPIIEAPKIESKVVNIEDRMMNAPLTSSRAFSLLKVS
jgi:hypothetical protein